MPKNKFQDVVFTAIMATIMVYGMVVYNVALNTGGVTGQTFLMAVHELPIMVPIAFVLEFFVVGKIARMLAFTVMTPNDRPQFITYAISICICCIMCPLMSRRFFPSFLCIYLRSSLLWLYTNSTYLPVSVHAQTIKLSSTAARTAASIHVSSRDSPMFPVLIFLV